MQENPTGPTLYKPAPKPVSHESKPDGPTLYKPESKPTTLKPKYTSPTLYTPQEKPTGPTLYKPDPRQINQESKYHRAPEIYTPPQQPIVSSGPKPYTPPVKSYVANTYVQKTEPSKIVHTHHHYKPTNRPVFRQTTEKGFLGHGKDFDHLAGAALVVGGAGILGGILGQQVANGK